jgi:DNA processing protein
MPESDLLYRVALAWIPGIGPVYTKKLLNHFGDARAIFRASPNELRRVKGIGLSRVTAILQFNQFALVEQEMAYMDESGIRCLFVTDKDYPQRLLECKEAPIMLYYKGNADLNAQRIVSIVGTRYPTEYGKHAVEILIRKISAFEPLVISGLAYGIDTAAHKSALANSLSTVAVLGQGLDQVYPPENKSLAVRMTSQGGLLTNFNTHSEMAPHNFPLRNRIVAGMCDALIVVETDTDGGSMLTVRNALSYKKKIFAFPGRLTDKSSRGCNQLIQQGAAQLLFESSQLITAMRWDIPKVDPAKQPTLFSVGAEEGLSGTPADAVEVLPEVEKLALRLLRENNQLSLDEFSERMSVPVSIIAVMMLNLEMRGLVRSIPGKRYRLAV